MASIIKRKKAYSVVYNYVDERGETKQKWETCHSHKEALKRKAEIENQMFNGTFLPPSKITVSSFLEDFVRTYGVNKWGVSMYDSNTAIIANYINPIIGDLEVQAITTRVVDQYVQTLKKTPAVQGGDQLRIPAERVCRRSQRRSRCLPAQSAAMPDNRSTVPVRA